jgi:FkbM family methyltransferase
VPLKVTRSQAHTLVSSLLDEDTLVVDCGVNKGSFSRWVVETFGCQVIGFEPDPRFFAKLPDLPKATFHQFAIAAREGNFELHLGTSKCSSLFYASDGHEDSVRVETKRLPLFLSEQGVERIDLLKLDIEGAEVELLLTEDGRFFAEKVVQMTIEFHDHKDPNGIPDIKSALYRMRQHGFRVFPFTQWGYGDVLLVNERLVSLRAMDQASLLFSKYTWGLRRLAYRMIGKNPE